MQFFPGTEEAWYRSVKEKVTRLLEELKNKKEITGLPVKAPREKIILVLEFILDVLTVERKAVVEDILYSPKAIGEKRFKDKNELENVIQLIELLLQAPREDLRLFEDIPTPIYGDLEVEYFNPLYRNQKVVKLNEGKQIKFIDPLTYRLNFINCNSDKVIATTLDLEALIEKEVNRKLNAVLVGVGEFIPRSTKTLLRKLSMELNLPVYLLTDNTPKMLYNLIKLIKGPVEPLPPYLQKYTTPHALWVGFSLEDTPENVKPQPLTGEDEKTLKKILEFKLPENDPLRKEARLIKEKKAKITPQEAEKIDVLNYLSAKIP